MEDWFRVREVGPRTWAIDDNGQDTIYLVEGDERALLIDTGWGIGDLPALVGSLTDKPVTVVNTHGHPDHALGDDQFPAVHITKADVPLVKGCYSNRQSFVDNHIGKMAPPGFDVFTWAAQSPTLVTIGRGHVFRLGGRFLEVLPLPGHSPGSICLLDRVNRQLFTGDSILAGTVWMYLEESRPLREFEANLKSLRAQAKAWDCLLPAHGDTPLAKEVLDDLIAGIAEILRGRAVGTPERTFVGEGLRCDFATTAIIYNPDRLE